MGIEASVPERRLWRRRRRNSSHERRSALGAVDEEEEEEEVKERKVVAVVVVVVEVEDRRREKDRDWRDDASPGACRHDNDSGSGDLVVGAKLIRPNGRSGID